MKLSELKINHTATIISLNSKDIALKKHLLDMGLTPNTNIKLIKVAPLGDPLEFKIRGYAITLRKEDADNIIIDNPCIVDDIIPNKIIHSHHPKVGEYKEITHKINPHKKLKFVLVGNQNAGKTTLFNALTGSNQHVGNFPGVTVEHKVGHIIDYPNLEVVDLPGIYSLSPYTNEEIISRNYILNNDVDGIINIVDATNIERNLYLSMQLLELNIPVCIALNMMDEVRVNGGTIDINNLERELGVPIIPISASKKEGLRELLEHAYNVGYHKTLPLKNDFCDFDSAFHRSFHAIEHLIEDHAIKASLPLRYSASKLIERDEIVLKDLNLSQNEIDTLEHIIKQLEEESKMDAMSAISDMRFSYIEKISSLSIIKPSESIERKRSIKIDEILTGKYTAIPAFLIIMGLIFYLSFDSIGLFLSNGFEILIANFSEYIATLLDSLGVNIIIKSLIIDSILNGVFSVLSFLPTIVILFLFLSILEDTGYIARVAFVMDKMLRKIGLSGRSFVPMLLGFGCTVPAIMATRTLPSQRDRRMTILLTPFMSCSAKLPIYAFFTAAFFPTCGGIVMFSLYFLGILLAILVAYLLKDSLFKGNPVPFVMELPNYRIPTIKNVYLLIKEKAMGFITKAFTIIFLSTIVVWFLQNFDLKFNLVSDPSTSILANLGRSISFIFSPLGFNDWRISTSLITGLIAKESVVTTLTVLMGNVNNITELFTTISAYSFLVFTLLYTPCVAAIATIKKEIGTKWSILIVIFQCVIAYIISFVVYSLLSVL